MVFDSPWIWFPRHSRHLLDILDLSSKPKNFYIKDIFESSSKCFWEESTLWVFLKMFLRAINVCQEELLYAQKINILLNLNKPVSKKYYIWYTVELTFLTRKGFESQYAICFCCCLCLISSCKVIHFMLFEHEATTKNCSSNINMLIIKKEQFWI